MQRYRAAADVAAIFEEFVEFWGNYVTEIYRLAKALPAVRETDEAAAWKDRMDAVRLGCRNSIDALYRDGMLDAKFSRDEAVDFLWTMLSVHNWEHRRAVVRRLNRLVLRQTQNARINQDAYSFGQTQSVPRRPFYTTLAR